MDKQEHRDFLLEAAKKVSTWILDKVIMERFKKQVKSFYDYFVECEDKGQIFDLLVLPYASLSDAHIGSIIDDDKPKNLSIPFDNEKSLQADYALLTIIHDKRLKNPRTPLISNGIWSKDEEWVELKWKELSMGCAYGSRDIQTHVELALERVEADLAKQLVSEEPSEPDSQKGKIGFLSELTPEEPSE